MIYLSVPHRPVRVRAGWGFPCWVKSSHRLHSCWCPPTNSFKLQLCNHTPRGTQRLWFPRSCPGGRGDNSEALPWSFPGGSAGEESACNAGDPSSIPGAGRSTGEGIGYPLQYSWASLVTHLVENPPAMRETWVLSLGLGRSPGEWKGYPLQNSGLENSVYCIVPGVPKSQTWLSSFHFTSSLRFVLKYSTAELFQMIKGFREKGYQDRAAPKI